MITLDLLCQPSRKTTNAHSSHSPSSEFSYRTVYAYGGFFPHLYLKWINHKSYIVYSRDIILNIILNVMKYYILIRLAGIPLVCLLYNSKYRCVFNVCRGVRFVSRPWYRLREYSSLFKNKL